jgi:hypothetical protein
MLRQKFINFDANQRFDFPIDFLQGNLGEKVCNEHYLENAFEEGYHLSEALSKYYHKKFSSVAEE